MFQPPRLATGGRALLRAALAAALLFSAVPGEAEAQRGPVLQLQSLEVVALGQLHRAPGDVTRWGLSYRKGRRAPGAQLEVTLERSASRRLVRHVRLTGPQGTLPIGPARGQARVHVRAFDRQGRPMAIRVGRGPRLHALAMATPVSDRWSNRPQAQPVRTHTRWERTRSQVTVNGRAQIRVAAAGGRPPARRPGSWDRERRARHWDRDGRGSATQLRAADRACRDAFTGNDNETRCLQLVRFRPRAVAQVAACEQAFTGDAAELRCLELDADARHVLACEEMLTGDAAELQCIETVGASRARPAMVDEVLRVCDERVGDAAELACVADLLH